MSRCEIEMVGWMKQRSIPRRSHASTTPHTSNRVPRAASSARHLNPRPQTAWDRALGDDSIHTLILGGPNRKEMHNNYTHLFNLYLFSLPFSP